MTDAKTVAGLDRMQQIATDGVEGVTLQKQPGDPALRERLA